MSSVALIPTVLDSRTEIELLFENAPLACGQCDHEGNLLKFNSAFSRLLGLNSGTNPSLHLLDFIDAQNRSETERLIAELLHQERQSIQVEGVNSGNGPMLRWHAWWVQQASGLDSILVLAEEHSPVRAAEQRLCQAERLEIVGRLAGGVAHDFNNLLTGILLYCDLLMASIETGHRARKYADEIRKAGMQASGLVRQLLAMARPANSQPRLLSLNETAEGVRNLLLRLIGENIELELRLDPNLGLIKMDPTQVQQILLNLVLNARDAMPRGGTILIETRNCKLQVLTDSVLGSCSAASLPCALLVVQDNGSGMDAATRAHVFEPFFTTKGGKGTGLGLATVHDIVSTNGGLIHLDSTPGQGTRISVLLPLAPGTAPESFRQNTIFCPARSGEVFSSKEEE